jgi:hypothetical protein
MDFTGVVTNSFAPAKSAGKSFCTDEVNTGMYALEAELIARFKNSSMSVVQDWMYAYKCDSKLHIGQDRSALPSSRLRC